MKPALHRMAAAAWGLSFVVFAFLFLPWAAVELNRANGWWRVCVRGGSWAGAGLILGGLLVILHCTGSFARLGRGTPVPLAPPERLVVSGLYRYSRNPIYIAYLAILLGYFLLWKAVALLGYTLVAFAGIQVLIVFREEPVLRERFGADYREYTRTVPRWFRFPFRFPDRPPE